MEENDAHKAAKDDTLSICGETMHFFPELRDWILTTLHAEHSIVAFKDKAPTHHFLVSVMKLVQSLVLFGYYTNTLKTANEYQRLEQNRSEVQLIFAALYVVVS